MPMPPCSCTASWLTWRAASAILILAAETERGSPPASTRLQARQAMERACSSEMNMSTIRCCSAWKVPIGTFQALQHRMVDMFISLEQARSMACLACSRVDAGGDPRSVSAAKIKIADAARHVSQEAVQLHGGMGMSEELKVSHAFRRLTVLAREFGDADHHLSRYAAL